MVHRHELRDALRNRVAEAPEVPPENAGWLDILSGSNKVRTECVLLSDVYRPVWVHWCGNRSAPCLGRQERCPPDLHTLPLAWHAYAWCLPANANVPWLLSLTHEGVRRCPELVAADAERLCRGAVLVVGRGVAKRDRQQVLHWTGRRVPEPLPKPGSLDDALWRLWRTHPLLCSVLRQNPELTRETDWLTTRAESHGR